MIKKILLGLLIIILAVAGYVWYKFSNNKTGGFDGDHAKKLELNSATPVFDKGFAEVMTAYFGMKDAFVNGDTAAARANCQSLIGGIDSIKMDEFKADTSGLASTIQAFLGDVKSNATRINNAGGIKEMRLAFYDASQQLYPLLKSIKYKGEKVYWHMCPMAFDDTKEAYWLDKKSGDGRTNPYLGKSDPKYGDKMLHCGEDKDSVVPQ